MNHSSPDLVRDTRPDAAVMERLSKLDQVAYVRFASVYRSFEDVGEFMEVLKSLLKKKGEAPAAAWMGAAVGKSIASV